MKTLLNFISKYKKTLLGVIVFLLFISFSFAIEGDGTTIKNSGGEPSISFLIMSILDLIGSIWLIFPIIAGKLLTNDFVYGGIIGLDVVLWKIWNFSRMLANFIIGFLFIYMILKYLLVLSDKDASLIKTGLPKIAISAILINMSWFLIGVLIDLSTILIAAFGSLPSNMGIKSPTLVFPENIEVSVQKCNPAVENGGCIEGTLDGNIKGKIGTQLKDLQTYETSLSGPLMFLGLSIIEIPTTKNNLLNKAYDFSAKKFKHDGATIEVIIKIAIFLMFLIPIIILIIINIVRIFWLWMYISFSPLLFLDWIWGKNKLAGANKAFAFKNVIGLIFSPALVVLGFSISIIFILGIVDAMNISEGNNTYTKNVKEKLLLDNSDGSILSINFGESQDTGLTGSKYIGGLMGYIIVSLIIVIIIWNIMKLSFKASDITKSISEKMFDFSEKLFKTVPIPTPMGDVSYGSIKLLGENIRSIPSDMLRKQSEKLNKVFNKVSDINDIEKRNIYEGLKDTSSSARFNSSLEKAINELSKFKNKSELETSPNAKFLIDKIESAINHSSLTHIKNDLSRASTYSDKLNIILGKQNEIKNNLRATYF